MRTLVTCGRILPPGALVARHTDVRRVSDRVGVHREQLERLRAEAAVLALVASRRRLGDAVVLGPVRILRVPARRRQKHTWSAGLPAARHDNLWPKKGGFSCGRLTVASSRPWRGFGSGVQVRVPSRSVCLPRLKQTNKLLGRTSLWTHRKWRGDDPNKSSRVKSASGRVGLEQIGLAIRRGCPAASWSGLEFARRVRTRVFLSGW